MYERKVTPQYFVIIAAHVNSFKNISLTVQLSDTIRILALATLSLYDQLIRYFVSFTYM